MKRTIPIVDLDAIEEREKMEQKEPETKETQVTDKSAETPQETESGNAEVPMEEKPETPTTPADPTAAELTDRLQRLAAEFENYKKKNAAEYERGRISGGEHVITAVLPAIDALDAAIANDKGEAPAVLEGLIKIRDLMLDRLGSQGLELIAPEKGEVMNPNIHEVIMAQPTTEVAPNTVLNLWQRGYGFRGRLIRAAKVLIAVEPEN